MHRNGIVCVDQKTYTSVYVVLYMRDNMVRVNDDELETLKKYRNENYPGVPLGFVIGDVIDTIIDE